MNSDGPIKKLKVCSSISSDRSSKLPSSVQITCESVAVCDGACVGDVLVSVLSLSLCFGWFTAHCGKALHSAHAVYRDTKKHISPVVLHPRLF